jgi:hypothetical protein
MDLDVVQTRQKRGGFDAEDQCQNHAVQSLELDQDVAVCRVEAVALNLDAAELAVPMDERGVQQQRKRDGKCAVRDPALARANQGVQENLEFPDREEASPELPDARENR